MMPFTLHLPYRSIPVTSPLTMAIINLTTDSFAIHCNTISESDILHAAERAIKDGADILDLGAQSTRPGAEMIGSEEESRRIQMGVRAVRREFPNIPISIDTFRAEVAEAAIDCGADIINDISGGEMDENMFATIARTRVPYILMHMRGNPQTMQTLTQYSNVMQDVKEYLARRTHQLRQMGAGDIIIDPGLGFAKTTDQNFELLSHLRELEQLQYPILVGLSRKSMIYRTLATTPEHALNGTTALNMVALMGGAAILRVHDVAPAVETIKLYNQLIIQNSKFIIHNS